MNNYKEVIMNEEIKVQSYYLDTRNIRYLHYFQEILNLEVLLGIIKPEEKIRKLCILLDI